MRKNGIDFCLASAAIWVSFTIFDTTRELSESSFNNVSINSSAETPIAGSIKISLYPFSYCKISPSVDFGSRAVAPLVCLKKTVS